MVLTESKILYIPVELAMIMDRLYGGVCYAGIDTDPELKYPKVSFIFQYLHFTHILTQNGSHSSWYPWRYTWEVHESYLDSNRGIQFVLDSMDFSKNMYSRYIYSQFVEVSELIIV